jgi:hypothetical protein
MINEAANVLFCCDCFDAEGDLYGTLSYNHGTTVYPEETEGPQYETPRQRRCRVAQHYTLLTPKRD